MDKHERVTDYLKDSDKAKLDQIIVSSREYINKYKDFSMKVLKDTESTEEAFARTLANVNLAASLVFMVDPNTGFKLLTQMIALSITDAAKKELEVQE